MGKPYNQGRDQGRRDGVLGNFLQGFGNAVTGNLFGSKVQKEFNKGYDKSKQERLQGSNKKNRR